MKRILLSLLVFALIFAGIQGAAAQRDSGNCTATSERSHEMNISVPATLDFGELTAGNTHEETLNIGLNVSNGTTWVVRAEAPRMVSDCGNFTLNNGINIVGGNSIVNPQNVDSGGIDDVADAFSVVFHQAIDWADRVAEYSTIITFTATTT
ncbi:MAG: hypothetical protein PHD26_09190 [Methanosarcinaceae archaeon]|nr:hypothetical protein [Methanosarcinaceae archaeon]